MVTININEIIIIHNIIGYMLRDYGFTIRWYVTGIGYRWHWFTHHQYHVTSLVTHTVGLVNTPYRPPHEYIVN